MERQVAPLMDTWRIDKPVIFVARVFVACLAVRIVLACLKAFESCGKTKPFLAELCKCLRGWG